MVSQFPASYEQAQRVWLAHLPLSDEELFGRESELQTLDAAWKQEDPQIIVLVASGGMGKTVLVSRWLRQMQAENSRGAERVVGWSFSASSGAEVSADEFLTYALRACGDPEPANGSPWNKGRRLGRLMTTRRTLLILENVDAVQYHDGEMQGRLKDPGLKALLYELSRGKSGLGLLTSSLAIKDLESPDDASVKQLLLPPLPPEAGAQFLNACGIKGPLDALKNMIKRFDGHPLALRLSAGYLRFLHRGDIRKIDLNAPLSTQERPDKHVRRVVDGFTIWLQRKPELDLLFMLGLFDLPIEAETMNALHHDGLLKKLLEPPVIKGVTEYAAACSEEQRRAAFAHLQRLHLLTEYTLFSDISPDATPGDTLPFEQRRILDCHPLVRQYFAAQLRKRLPGSWRAAHNRLYDYYHRQAGRDSPETLDAMQPFLAAIEHGCQAERYEEVFEEIYWPRLHHHNRDYCAKTLETPGTDLAAVSHFLTPAWQAPGERVSAEIRIRLWDIAALRLETSGRLRETLEVVKKGMAFWHAQANWENAAQHAVTLSRLLVPAGEIEQALIHARLALQLAAQPAHKVHGHINLIRALHLSGDLQEADQECRALETLYQEHAPESLIARTPRAEFICGDLLVQLGKFQDVREWLVRKNEQHPEDLTPLSRALGNLLSGKILLFETAQTDRFSLQSSSPDLQQAQDAAPETRVVMHTSRLHTALDEQPGLTEKTHTGRLLYTGEEAEVLTRAKEFLNQTIMILQDSGELEWLIQALLTRAVVFRRTRAFSDASADLEEIRILTELGGMTLYLTDYYLESARLAYAQWATNQARFSGDAAGEEFYQQMHNLVEGAEALIWRTGYHLRDAELATLMTLLKESIPKPIAESEIAEQEQALQWFHPQKPKVSRPARRPQEIRRDAQPQSKPVPLPRSKQEGQEAEQLQSTPAPPAQKEQEIRWIEHQEQRTRRAEEYQQLYLYPGELYIAERPTIVWTLLGSCIAVILYNKRLHLGAICHAQLPEEHFQNRICREPCMHPCYSGDRPDPARFKYVTCSIRYLYEQFVARGITSAEITVKLFGGASVLAGLPDTINVGEENINVARQVLQEYHLRIIRKDIGGDRGRTLYFYSDTGEVFMKKHRSNIHGYHSDTANISTILPRK